MVYLIHLEIPIKGIRHYIGFCFDKRFDERQAEHRASTFQYYLEPVTLPDGRRKNGTKKGKGCTILAVANSEEIGWQVTRKWEHADRGFERRFKDQHNAGRSCPTCSGDKAMNRNRNPT